VPCNMVSEVQVRPPIIGTWPILALSSRLPIEIEHKKMILLFTLILRLYLLTYVLME
jgi:hypothetical protein